MRKRVSRGSRPWVCRCDEPAVTGSVKEANERAACCGGRVYRGPSRSPGPKMVVVGEECSGVVLPDGRHILFTEV